MRMQVSIPKNFVFIFTIALLTLGVLGNLSYGDTDPAQIYWTDAGTSKIQRANLDGSNVKNIHTTDLFSFPGSIALDTTDRKIYWTSLGFSAGIQRANLDGSNVENLVEMGLFDPPVHMALDVDAGKIYWTQAGFSLGIRRANLDGSDVENLVEMNLFSGSSLEGIALDVIDRKMYWTDTGTHKIQRANLDGSDIEDLVIGVQGVKNPGDIALDLTNRKMYWTDADAGKIRRANLDGSNVEDLITTGLDSPIGIALDIEVGKMYWTHGEWDEDTETRTNGKIQRANLDGSNVQDLVTTGVDNPISIALSIPSQRTPAVAQQEEAATAAKLSSATPAAGATIAVNATITLTFSSDPGEVTVAGAVVIGGGRTRTVVGPFAKGALTLAVGWTNGNGSTSLSYIVKAADNTAPTVTGGTVRDGDEDVDPEKINGDGKIEVTFSEEVSGNLALQTEGGKDVGWLGSVRGTTGTLELVSGKEIGAETTYVIKGRVSDAAGNRTEVRITFTTAGTQADVKTTRDPKASTGAGTGPYRSIYWTDEKSNKIQWANLDGTNIQNIATNLYPGGLALEGTGSKMYWTDKIRDEIWRANLDGSNVEDIVTTGLDGPNSIALDVVGGKMYWTSRSSLGEDKIQRANLDGSNIQDLVTTGLDGPWNIALDVAGGKMYWTNRWEDKIQRANLDGSNVQDIVTNVYPVGIALDGVGKKVYWTDWLRGKIQRANLNGTNIQDIVTTGLEEPAGITLDVAGGKMYWADPGTGKIQRANLDGSNVQDIVTGLGEPSRIGLGTSSPGVWNLDVNKDGKVTPLDIIEIGKNYGETVTDGANPRADVNADGKVDINDLIAVAKAVDAAAAAPALAQQLPSLPFTAQALQQWIRDAKHQNLSPRGIAVLEHLLAALTRSEMPLRETALLPNYPNPFNPETWIPYQLSKPTDVTLHIYSVDGSLVRTLALGHQPAGMYQSRARAAYWNGRNALGEPVASGVYFYTLTAGDFTATRKMLIRK